MRRNTSPLLEDKEATPGVLDNMPDFDGLFERLAPNQIDAILDEQMAGSASAEDRSRETVRYSNSASDVDKAFSDLMSGA